MTNELEALGATRATVDPPSPESRDRARQRWSAAGPDPDSTVDLRRAHHDADHRGRTFAARSLVAAALVSALVAGGWIVTRNRVDSVKPLHIVTVTSLTPAAATAPQVFLLVGADSRAFVDSDAQKQEFGDPATITGARSDSMILVRVDPKTHHNLAVSLPRDLYVDIPGCGEGKLNAAFDGQQSCAAGQNGSQLLVATITHDLGVPINHVIQVDFPQFAALAGDLGGLHIRFPTPVRDRFTGLDEPAGCPTLTADQSLAFVRSRHLEYLANGRWIEDPTGDLGRMARQQLALRQLAAAAEARLGTDPRPLLETLFAHVRVDAGFTADDALAYFAALRGTATLTATLPATPAVRDQQEVLLLDPSAQPLLDALAHGGTSTPAPLSTSTATSSAPSPIATTC